MINFKLQLPLAPLPINASVAVAGHRAGGIEVVATLGTHTQRVLIDVNDALSLAREIDRAALAIRASAPPQP